MGACTRSDEPEMAMIKEVKSLLDLSSLSRCRHPNLVEILEIYEYEKATMVVIEYVATSLENVIAVDLKLEEIHILTVCNQVRTLILY